jgi:hypothetical protein
VDYLDLTGYYTYRSLKNLPEPADDFNILRFGEGELFVWVAPDGAIRGTLAFPADALAVEKEFMDISGRVTSWSPVAVEFEGIGRPETGTAEFDYKYQATLAPAYPDAVGQRPALVGTVMRAKQHGTAAAGFTATMVAVRRDFLAPRQIPQVALIPEAIEMLASRRHRLQHAVWHTTRLLWHTVNADPGAVAEIDKRGWWPKRPPFLETRALNLENGAGEDFLYMHRKMLHMLREVYAGAGATSPAGWTDLPAADAAQMVYREATVPAAKRFVFDPDASGFMVPPPAGDDPIDRMIKSPAFLNGSMRPLAGLFRSSRYLSALTLGQLGNLLEFTIHGWMHVRWTHTVYDAKTGEPIGREDLFDVDPRWDDPANDDLGDFYSSHVHPTFWRLHGWIDDRINDWATVNADRITHTTVDDVPWFAADGELVKVSDPFYWPSSGHHHHHSESDDSDVRVMEEVLEIISEVVVPTPAEAAAVAREAAGLQPAKLAFRDLILDVTIPS